MLQMLVQMYIPEKHAKYGFKIRCLTNAFIYTYNAYLQCEKESDNISSYESLRSFSKPTQAFLGLSKSIFNTNSNITAGFLL